MFPSGEPSDEPRFATGTLVVYVDGNGNGALDGRQPGHASPDRVIAASDKGVRSLEAGALRQLEVHYFERDFTSDPDGAAVAFPAGYSQQPYYQEGWPPQDTQIVIDPIGTLVELQVTGAPDLQERLCEERCDPFEPYDPNACPEHPADLEQLPEGSVMFDTGITPQRAGYFTYGTDGHTTIHKACIGGELRYSRVACEGCGCSYLGCMYPGGNDGELDCAE